MNIAKVFSKGLLQGFGFFLGLGLSALIAVTVNATFNSGDTLTSASLNALKTAVESIPNWAKSGSNTTYTEGGVGIGTTNPTARLHVHKDPNLDVRFVANNGYIQYDFTAGGAAVDEKRWRFFISSTNKRFAFEAMNDAYTINKTALYFERSGVNITNSVFPNGDIGVMQQSKG